MLYFHGLGSLAQAPDIVSNGIGAIAGSLGNKHGIAGRNDRPPGNYPQLAKIPPVAVGELTKVTTILMLLRRSKRSGPVRRDQ